MNDFTLILAVIIWTQHQQFMAGYDNWFFTWKTPQEKSLRKAIINKRLQDAGMPITEKPE